MEKFEDLAQPRTSLLSRLNCFEDSESFRVQDRFRKRASPRPCATNYLTLSKADDIGTLTGNFTDPEISADILTIQNEADGLFDELLKGAQ